MTRAFDLEAIVVHLEQAKERAKSYFDAHFLSELDHLINQVKANQDAK